MCASLCGAVIRHWCTYETIDLSNPVRNHQHICTVINTDREDEEQLNLAYNTDKTCEKQIRLVCDEKKIQATHLGCHHAESSGQLPENNWRKAHLADNAGCAPCACHPPCTICAELMHSCPRWRAPFRRYILSGWCPAFPKNQRVTTNPFLNEWKYLLDWKTNLIYKQFI